MHEFTGQIGVPAYQIARLSQPRHTVALVIPVLNENGRLLGQLQRIHAADSRVDVVIADGGSTDGSTEVNLLEALGVTTLLTKTGSGRLSAQLRMAIHYCLGSSYQGIITMDGNGKDNAADIAVFVEALRRGLDFVQGSRFIRGGAAINTPLLRYLGIRLVHAPLTSISAGKRYTDSTNGFRGHSRRLLEDPRVAPLRDDFDTYELLAYLPIRAARLGYRVAEVPVTRAYPSGGDTPTKIHGAKGHLRLLSILAKAGVGRYNPGPQDRRGSPDR